MLARWRRFRMLLTADAEAETTPIDPGPIDVLKVAHHGSDDAGLGDLLDRSRPKLAVISVGADNPFGHPTPGTLATLAAHGVPVLRTDRDGTIVLDVESQGSPGRHRRLSSRLASTNRRIEIGVFARRTLLPVGWRADGRIRCTSKREHSRPRSKARFSVLGNGLLERTRSTTFGLLGMTAAVGLAIIAVALHGSWPLIEGSRVPRAPVRARVGRRRNRLERGGTLRTAVRPAVGRKEAVCRIAWEADAGTRKAAGRPARGPPAELVSSPAAPVGRQGGRPQRLTRFADAPGTGAAFAPLAAGADPGAERRRSDDSAFDLTGSRAAAVADRRQKRSPPKPPPVESNVPPWSNGQGHAYGRDSGHGCDDSHGHDDDHWR